MKMKKERSKVYVIKQKLEFGDSKNFIKTIQLGKEQSTWQKQTSWKQSNRK